MRLSIGLRTRKVAVKLGIIELLAAFTLMPKQRPTERKETIELGNELLRKVRSAGHLSHIPHGLTFFQEGETRVATPIDTAECFESSLVLAELEALAHSTPDDMIRVRPWLGCCFHPLNRPCSLQML